MRQELTILIFEALTVYLLVLSVHSLRQRVGLGPFYALLGGLTAVMSWVTDAGVRVEVAGVSFWVGSTVFYTSLLLGVFVVYVFDGPRATRIAILTVAGVSAMVPLIALALHIQIQLMDAVSLPSVPVPSLRINVASVLATVADLVFLAIAWEFLGRPWLRTPLSLRALLTLLGVMWLDVLLFATGAFFGSPDYVSIMTGTFVSRFFISLFAFPALFFYLNWQQKKAGGQIEERPVLAILKEVAEVRAELGLAHQEIARRTKAEEEKARLILELQNAMAEVKTLRGFLPICAWCKKVRDDDGYWQQLETYIKDHSDAVLSHGLCPDCAEKHFPTR